MCCFINCLLINAQQRWKCSGGLFSIEIKYVDVSPVVWCCLSSVDQKIASLLFLLAPQIPTIPCGHGSVTPLFDLLVLKNISHWTLRKVVLAHAVSSFSFCSEDSNVH